MYVSLIRRRRAVMTTQSSAPDSADICCHSPASGCLGTWRPALMLTVGSWPAASSATSTTDTTSTNASGSQPAKKNTRGPCRQLKTAKVTRVTNSRINIGYDERHRAAPTAELHSSLAHDIGHVIRSYCPMQWKSWKTNYNLEDLEKSRWRTSTDSSLRVTNSGRATCTTILRRLMIRKLLLKRNKAKINKGNRKKKTLLHHSGSRPFSYRMDARRQGGPNSQRSTSLATFMFDLGMSWPSPSYDDEKQRREREREGLVPNSNLEEWVGMKMELLEIRQGLVLASSAESGRARTNSVAIAYRNYGGFQKLIGVFLARLIFPPLYLGALEVDRNSP
ncbi:hypothetical protein Prudu_019063 [Prunus dulcis]|uniref:Uncharacterized protein n=1 Tax=Prunus dulcis TaxID=3755 RepID=A0A4Y1RTD0_PRUDU|nr:hypothetical protein Prudu_019063 [Prunus dulcis]